jgi:signal transduction histidine kinase
MAPVINGTVIDKRRHMKPLLSKTTRPFLVYVLIILLISVPVYYLVIEKIWIGELDQHNKTLAKTTAAEFNKQPFSEAERKDRVHFWNNIQPGIFIEELAPGAVIRDSIFTADVHSPYLPPGSDDNFRVLITTIHIQGKAYYFRSVTSFEDTRDTVTAIALLTIFFFLCIVIGLLLLNRKLSGTIWRPFRNTLDQLKTFNLNQQTPIAFNATVIAEFEELNSALSRLIEHSIATYKTQQEFTENAAHELQTPLAILKNKLDILLQDENLSEQQYIIVEEMNKTLTRSARIHKNLLLLAKIDNQQFNKAESVHLDNLLRDSITVLREYMDQKNMVLTINILPDVVVTGNTALTEILISNLVLNAIRHTHEWGTITITLTAAALQVANSGKQALDEASLFNRFAQHAADSKGSGLGLAIVREICRFQQWTVTYQFRDGQHLFAVQF